MKSAVVFCSGVVVFGWLEATDASLRINTQAHNAANFTSRVQWLLDSGSSEGNFVEVQVLSSAPIVLMFWAESHVWPVPGIWRFGLCRNCQFWYVPLILTWAEAGQYLLERSRRRR